MFFLKITLIFDSEELIFQTITSHSSWEGWKSQKTTYHFTSFFDRVVAQPLCFAIVILRKVNPSQLKLDFLGAVAGGHDDDDADTN